MDHRSGYPYSRRSKPLRSYAEDDDDDNDDDDVVLGGEVNDSAGEEEEDDDDDDDEDYNAGGRHCRRQRKQRRIESGSYPFAPRPDAGAGWSEKGTFVLLDIWGERFLQLGRSSLRSEDWNDVAERVSEVMRTKVSVLDCRNRLNALRTRYKREKAKLGASGSGNTKWVYFRKMDALMTMSPRQLQQQEQCGLACGVDSGEFVFMNPQVYLDHSNALDEMRDSPGNSESEEEEDEDDGDDEEEDEESYRMLSESIKRVGEIYEKIEDSKRQHMMELERMRAEFQRDLELQKKEIIDQTRAEIAKLSQGDAHDSECSAENAE